MKKLLLGLLMFYSFFLKAQPSINWQKCIGGNISDIGLSIQQTTDGGYILSGFTDSNDGDVTGNNGGRDAWIVKLSNFGIIQWQKCLGGSLSESSMTVQQTSDGGYILSGGYTNSNDGDVNGNHGSYDVWVVKLSSLGVIQWQKCLGGSGADFGTSIQQTSDGGYILSAQVQSNNGDISNNHGSDDAWIVKLNSLGAIQWQKCYGGSSIDIARHVQQTLDGGYVFTGYTMSSDGDITGSHYPYDAWIVKLNNVGVIQWQKYLGGSSSDTGQFIKQSTDGGYILVGSTLSNDGNVIGNHGANDIWVVKLSSVGIIQWQKCLGGSRNENSKYIQPTSDGGYILSGKTNSVDGDVFGNLGSDDAWIVKLNNLGAIEWQRCLGGSGDESGESIQQISEGEFILTGYTNSVDGDVSDIHGSNDVWVVKLSNTLNSQNFNINNDLKIYPNPAKDLITIDFGNTSNVIRGNYKIINMLGQEVQKGALFSQQNTVDLSNLKGQGVYSVKIYDNTNDILEIKKIIIQQ